MPTYRTLRCANAQLYLAATVLVAGAAIYVLCCKEPLWQQLTAVAALLFTPLWCAHYLSLSYTITAEGITRRAWGRSTTLRWSELAAAGIQEQQNHGTACCTITLQAGEQSMHISSDLLPLDDVQELAQELRAGNLLH
jgi:hypothetical protein